MGMQLQIIRNQVCLVFFTKQAAVVGGREKNVTTLLEQNLFYRLPLYPWEKKLHVPFCHFHFCNSMSL